MRRIFNRPGQGALDYRAGHFSDFVSAMQSAAKSSGLPDIESTTPAFSPLSRLNIESHSDLTNGIISAWARVCDVLSFYQERIANEGYLDTVIEDVSVVNLIAGAGITKRPAIAAQTYLSFQLIDTKTGKRAISITHNGDIAVQSVPVKGALPATFENIETAELRPHWNMLIPWQAGNLVAQSLRHETRSLRLTGVQRKLKPGLAIWIKASQGETNCNWVVSLEKVVFDVEKDFTVLVWETPLGDLKPSQKIKFPVNLIDVIAFTNKSRLFGYNAKPWDKLSETRRSEIGSRQGGLLELQTLTNPKLWTSGTKGLPVNIKCKSLLGSQGGMLFLGGENGLYISSDEGQTFAPQKLPQGRYGVYGLYIDEFQTLYVGGPGGRVLISEDKGQSWAAQPKEVEYYPDESMLDEILEFLHLKSIKIFKWHLNATIRSFAISSSSEKSQDRRIFIGTDQGVYTMLPNSRYWATFNRGKFKAISAETGAADVVVHKLLLSDDNLVAATSQGAFYTQTVLDNWMSSAGLPDGSVAQALAGLSTSANNYVFLGTNVGAFISTDNGQTFTDFNQEWGKPDKTGTPPTTINPQVFDLIVSGDIVSGYTLMASTSQGLFRRDISSGGEWTSLNKEFVPRFKIDQIAIESWRDAKNPDDLTLPPNLKVIFANQGIHLNSVKISPQKKHGQIIGWTLIENFQTTNKPSPKSFFISNVPLPQVSQILPPLASPAVKIAQAGGQLFAATPFGPQLDIDWPNYKIQDGKIALDRIVKNIAPDSHVALLQQRNVSHPHVTLPKQRQVNPPLSYESKINNCEETSLTEFGKQGTVTQLTARITNQLERFDLRKTRVYTNSLPMEPLLIDDVPYKPIQGQDFQFEGMVNDLSSGKSIVLTGPRPSGVITHIGGVFEITGPQNPFKPIDPPTPLKPTANGLSDESILALIIEGDRVYAATQTGLLLCNEQKKQWRRIDNDFSNGKAITSLAVTPSGRLLAGTESSGVFETQIPKQGQLYHNKVEWIRAGESLSKAKIITLIGPKEDKVHLIAKTLAEQDDAKSSTSKMASVEAGGLYSWDEKNNDWVEVPIGSRDFSSLTSSSDGFLFAGTINGIIYKCAPGKSSWVKYTKIDTTKPITAMATNERGQLTLGTAEGRVYQLDYNLTSPKLSILGRMPGHAKVQTFLFTQNYLWVGTRGAGIFRLDIDADPKSWTAVRYSISNDVRTLVSGGSRGIFAGCTTRIYLSVSRNYRLDRHPILSDYIEDVVPGLNQQIVPKALSDALKSAGIVLGKSPDVELIEPGQVWLINNAQKSFLVRRAEFIRPVELRDNYIMVFALNTLGILKKVASKGGTNFERWEIEHNQHSLGLWARQGEILAHPAKTDAADHSEIAVIDAVNIDPDTEKTHISLTRPLRQLFDPSQTRINANLVRASQGQTVKSEILGSGNYARSNQSFLLKHSPLTYLKKPETLKRYNTLHVEVKPPVQALGVKDGIAGEFWHETPSFAFASPTERVYSLRDNAKGIANVRFGNGANGARLPTGTNNVLANYRYGAGTNGNVKANSLIAMMRRPAGIRVVTNPVAAQGGMEAETIPELRSRLSNSLSGFDRIVTLDDYAGFTLAQPGLSKVKPYLVYKDEAGKQTITPVKSNDQARDLVSIHLAIGLEDQRLLEALPDVKHNLCKSIEQSRADNMLFTLGGYYLRYFNLHINVTCRPDVIAEKLTDEIRAFLNAKFSYSGHDIGASVYRNDILSDVNAIPGVREVDVTALFEVGLPETNPAKLAARPARTGSTDTQILPPDLWLINSELSGLVIVMETS